MGPIIVLGMHRSGTTLLAEILADLGVFIGNDTNVHNESKIIFKLNESILRISHAHWDNPQLVENLIADETSFGETVGFIGKKVGSYEFIYRYWGFHNVLLIKFRAKKRLWGWKEPRTTVTFPVWNKNFPDAKYIYIHRNGIDVAQSLLKREISRIGEIHSPIYSLRCLDLQRAFDLWEEYGAFFHTYRDLIPDDRLMMIAFEELVSSPAEQVTRICEFLHVDICQKTLNSIATRMNKQSKFKFADNEALIDFYKKMQNRPLMKYYRYDGII